MISVKVGDLFASGAQTLVNTVNTVGVMGKGIALEFKRRFPAMYRDYEARCARGELTLGRPYVYRVRPASADFFDGDARPGDPELIVNFPTKDHWRSVSRVSDITEGLQWLVANYQEWGIKSIAVPPLGCGLGQLEWRIVGRTLYRYLRKMDIPVEMYAPYGTPEVELTAPFLGAAGGRAEEPPSRLDPAWVALAAIVGRTEREPYRWPVGRTSFQKMAYFATAAGIPTGLRYQRGSYGPFAPELKPILTKLVNNGVLRERKLGRMHSVETGPTYRDAVRSYLPELTEWTALIERIADLFLRMDTRDAELAATVMFAAMGMANEAARPSEADVFDAVKQWKVRRRPPLRDEDVAVSIRNLNILRWVTLRASEGLPLPQEV